MESMLKRDRTEWMLYKGNPSVRFFTLPDIFDESVNDVDMDKSRRAIMRVGHRCSRDSGRFDEVVLP